MCKCIHMDCELCGHSEHTRSQSDAFGRNIIIRTIKCSPNESQRTFFSMHFQVCSHYEMMEQAAIQRKSAKFTKLDSIMEHWISIDDEYVMPNQNTQCTRNLFACQLDGINVLWNINQANGRQLNSMVWQPLYIYMCMHMHVHVHVYLNIDIRFEWKSYFRKWTNTQSQAYSSKMHAQPLFNVHISISAVLQFTYPNGSMWLKPFVNY